MLISFQKYIYPVSLMCLWLSVSRSGFYHWRTRPASAAATRRGELRLLITAVFEDADQTYGYRRVQAELGGPGWTWAWSWCATSWVSLTWWPASRARFGTA